MEHRSTLGRVRGLGASRDGIGHWWAQRLTAVALVPLTLWFVFAAVALTGADYDGFKDWVGAHGNLVLLVLLIIALFHHAQLGLQEVIEDYVHGEAAKLTGLVIVKFAALAAAAASVLAVLKVAFAG